MGEIVNVFSVLAEGGDDRPEGYRRGSAELGPSLGSQQMGATVYELPPGQSSDPYHWEGIEEEWLLVLTGTPTLRSPEGERVLSPGDLVAFPPTAEGAHKVTNASGDPARILMLSTQPPNEISICVYPDSNKVSAWPPGLRLSMDNPLEYWDGES